LAFWSAARQRRFSLHAGSKKVDAFDVLSQTLGNYRVQALPTARLKMTVGGAVQGVGFRPFVHRLATGLGLAGWVHNSCQGVALEVEGPRPEVESFLLRLEAERPPCSFIQSLEAAWLDPVGYKKFEITASEAGGERTALVLPDIAPCPDCVREIFDPLDRRYLYPFANCTHCGPRFSIIESLPYDRGHTAMKSFPLCPRCREEFDNPLDRRFHAQPNACPACGPRLELWNRQGETLRQGHEALMAAAEVIRQGGIVALKGLGGFHLVTPAHDDAAVRRLRERKHRAEKPFALMFPSLPAARMECEISPLEERLLRSPEAPIVLLGRRAGRSALSREIAPRHPCLGVMLPSTPLHHLLMAELAFPVIATSGNLSEEPICIDEREALQRLGRIADALLVHNRPIVRAVDDSVVRVMMGRELVLRRARGYAPLPVTLRAGEDAPAILAVGAHLKNTVALALGRQVFLSQHIGDLESVPAYEAFLRTRTDLQNLFQAQPSVVCADAHPDYLSTQWAAQLLADNPALRGVSVQHHSAHVLACMADNELEPPVLGVAWDGAGYGLDGTIWGGEFLLVTDTAIHRRAHLRQFRLPGGEKAIKEPRRIALALLREMLGEEALTPAALPPNISFSPAEWAGLKTMLKEGIHSPLTSSVGRLFDGVAALIGLRQKISFEGQAAMELESCLEGVETGESYQFKISDAGQTEQAPFILDWQPVLEGVLADLQRGLPAGEISAKFHHALVEALISIARRVGRRQVALTGGCFQNRYLTERAVKRLEQEGFRPYWHQRVPPNDGGIALGQILAVRRSGP
jgi:hydrogenase maturation protein HypF